MTYNKVIKRNLFYIFIMAISGLGFGFVTGSKSVITDGIVSTVIFVSSYVGLYVHSSLKTNDFYNYPYGKWRFEYIYNLLRMVVLLMIIAYSFLESIYTIFHYIISGVVPKELILIQVLPYFIIKIIVVFFSLSWLKKNYEKKNINKDIYKVETNSIKVDGILTIAILVGIVVFSHIQVISKVADACTLLVVSIILGISVSKELQELIIMMIGKRIFQEEEKFIMGLINTKFNEIDVKDVYLEKHGIISMLYIQCSFKQGVSSEKLSKLQLELKDYLRTHGVENPMLHFYFEENI